MTSKHYILEEKINPNIEILRLHLKSGGPKEDFFSQPILMHDIMYCIKLDDHYVLISSGVPTAIRHEADLTIRAMYDLIIQKKDKLIRPDNNDTFEDRTRYSAR